MGLIAGIKRILFGDDSSVSAAEAAMAKLTAERAAALTAIEALAKQLDEALSADDNDKKIDELESAIKRHDRTLAKLEKLEPKVEAEKVVRLTEAGQNRFLDQIEEDDADFSTLERQASTALETRARLVARNATKGFGFEKQSNATFPNPTFILSPDGLDQFRLALERRREAVIAVKEELRARLDALRARLNPPAASPSPPPAPAVIPLKPTPKSAPAVVRAAPPAPKPPPRERIVETPHTGENAYTVIKGGIEPAGRSALAVGDVIAFKPEEALPLLHAGSITLAEPSVPTNGGTSPKWGVA